MVVVDGRQSNGGSMLNWVVISCNGLSETCARYRSEIA
jgi:hypothetical protein